jgi:hypothetical protein
MADEPVKEEVISKQEAVLPLLPKDEVPSGKEDIPQANEETSEANEDLKIESLVPKAGIKAEPPLPENDIPSAMEVEPSVEEDVPSTKESAKEDIAIAEEKPKADISTAKEDVPLETNVISPKQAETEVDMASDPEEDDLSDLDGEYHGSCNQYKSNKLNRRP